MGRSSGTKRKQKSSSSGVQPSNPSKPPNKFFLYAAKEQKKGKTVAEIWKSMTDAEKKPHEDEYNQLMADYLSKQKTTNKKRHRKDNRLTTMTVPKFFQTVKMFNEEKMGAVSELGFDDLLKLNCTHLNKNLCEYLVNRFDIDKCGLHLCDEFVEITPRDVKVILGIPNGSVAIEPSKGNNNMSNSEWVIQGDFMRENGLKVSNLGERLRKWGDNPANDDFKRLFVLYACGCILSHNTGHFADETFLAMVDDVTKIDQYNWAACVLNDLVEGIEKFKRERTLKNCNGSFYFLKLLYLVRVQGNDPQPPSPSHRVASAWTDQYPKSSKI